MCIRASVERQGGGVGNVCVHAHIGAPEAGKVLWIKTHQKRKKGRSKKKKLFNKTTQLAMD